MKDARMLGNYVEHLASKKGLTISALSKVLKCTEFQVHSFLKGRSHASFSQLSSLAKELDTTVESLLSGNMETYNATVVHCMNDFQNVDNREEVLDIIDNYIDIANMISMQN